MLRERERVCVRDREKEREFERHRKGGRRGANERVKGQRTARGEK